MSDVVFLIPITAIVCGTIASVAKARAKAQQRELDMGYAGSAAMEARLARIEQAVDAIAVEVERVAEGQRFTTSLLADRVPGVGRSPEPVLRP